MRNYLLSAAAAIALMTSGAAAHEKPVTLIQGLGDHHHIIATAQQDAQRYFDQGLVLAFAFNHAEAIRVGVVRLNGTGEGALGLIGNLRERIKRDSKMKRADKNNAAATRKPATRKPGKHGGDSVPLIVPHGGAEAGRDFESAFEVLTPDERVHTLWRRERAKSSLAPAA